MTPHRIAIVAAAAIACSSSAPPPSNLEPAVIDRDYPALAWVPGDASGAVVAARLDDLVRLSREGGDFLLMLAGRSMRADVDTLISARFGASPFRIDDLAAAGLNAGGSAAVYARAAGVTAVLPVADRARVAETLARHTPTTGTERTRRHQRDVVVWADRELSVSYTLTDRWLLVHAGGPDGDLGWLDEIERVGGRGLAAEPLFARAKTQAASQAKASARRYGWAAPSGPPDVVGVIRPGALISGFGIGDRCALDAAAAAPAVLVGAEVESNRVAGFFELALTDAADAVLAADRPAPPATGMMDLIGEAPIAGMLTVPPSTLETIRRRWACRELDEPLDASALMGATGVVAAAWRLDPSKPTATRGVVRITGVSPRLLDSMLDQIPGRSLLERTRPIDGVKLKVLGGRLGIPEIAYRARPGETAVGSPARRLAAALSGSPSPAVPLVHLRLAPPAIPNLPQLLGEVTAALTGDSSRGVKLGNRLARYAWGELSLVHEPGVLRLVAAMELAGQK